MAWNDAVPVSAVVLAGGLSRRLGGRDKGLIPLGRRSLAGWVSHRIAGQVTEVLVSANRNLGDYAALGHTVAPDYLPGRLGPLAGLLAAARTARMEWLLTLPCDAPFVPLDLARRLFQQARETDAPLLRAEDETGIHYAVMLVHRRLLPDMETYLESGGRAVRTWQERHDAETVRFDDDPYAFLNVNTPEDLRVAERIAPRYEENLP